MTAYADLTPYEYELRATRQPGAAPTIGLNVGWLGRSADFTRGGAKLGLRDDLALLAGRPKNLMRGRHHCELCDKKSPIVFQNELGEDVALGNGEIRVDSDLGCLIAPTLVLHYVEDHDYQPPDEFVRAVRSAAAEIRASR